MADNDSVVLGKINYWLREQQWRSVYTTAADAQAKYAADPILKFFAAYSQICEGRIQDGIRELDALKDKQDVNLCSTLALIIAHKRTRNIDKETVQVLDAKLKDERKQAGEKGLYFAGLFLFHNGKYDKAREYIDRMLKMNSQSKQGLAIKGWIELSCGAEINANKSIKFFDEAISLPGGHDIGALFGKAEFFRTRNNIPGAIDVMNQAVVAFPNLVPALIERSKLYLALNSWDECIEQAERALTLDGNCIQALAHIILYELCREGSYSDTALKIADLLKTMDRAEPRTAILFNKMAGLFCRNCGRNKEVLVQTYYMQERAVSITSNDAEYMTELGYQCLLQGKVKEAMKCYRNAMKMDESSVQALTGVIWCQLMEGQLDEAAQQLDFLNEIQQSIGRTAQIAYLSAVQCIKRQQSPDKAMKFLDEAIKTHFDELKKTPFWGMAYFTKLNPDFLMTLVKDYLAFAPSQPTVKGQAVDPVLVRCQRVLEPLIKAVPGLIEALYLHAKVKYLSGDPEGAQVALRACIDKDDSFSPAHILLAEIHLSAGNFKLANSSLELGLSLSFEVRDQPSYHIIKARILKKQGSYEEAVKTLQFAMELPGVKRKASALSTGKSHADVSFSERVSIFLELADALRILGKEHEAAKIMTDALTEFTGTSEEIRIKISNADLAVARGDVNGALDVLRQIGPDQPYFVQAREKMADIYLRQRKDKRLYAACYRELQEKQPSIQTALLLGDAYMGIQEPEKAIEVYEKALKQNPRDGQLASKIGQALVITHNYGKAINYYEAALRTGGPALLRHDLGELLIKLRHYDKAEKILTAALEKEPEASNIESLSDRAKNLQLLARVYKCQGHMDKSMKALKQAQDIQSKALSRAQLEEPDVYGALKKTLTGMWEEMAIQHIQLRDTDQAIKCYKEALQHADNNTKLLLALSRLYLQKEDLDNCERQCMTLLKSAEGQDADQATVMLADLKFRRNDYQGATYHFEQMLTNRPDNFTALAKLIDLLRRAGRLDDAPRFLQLAEKSNPRVQMDTGYNYCQGLYTWYTGNPNTALKHFNRSRKDSDWGYRATCNMIEICLNPDNNTVGGELFEGGDQAQGKTEDMINSEQMALKTAEKLLQDLRPVGGDLRPTLLTNMLLVSTRRTDNAQRALAAFTAVANAETSRDCAGALYGQATSYMVIKQPQKAKVVLKKLAESTWTVEDSEDLEKSWLLLADIHIQGSRTDEAITLLHKCLQYNKSCCKAYEYLAYIQEKEQAFKEASQNYEKAWKFSNKSNPNIGYKLAFAYLKVKRFVDAMDICQQILAQHPQYPKIRKEILEKARQNIRV